MRCVREIRLNEPEPVGSVETTQGRVDHDWKRPAGCLRETPQEADRNHLTLPCRQTRGCDLAAVLIEESQLVGHWVDVDVRDQPLLAEQDVGRVQDMGADLRRMSARRGFAKFAQGLTGALRVLQEPVRVVGEERGTRSVLNRAFAVLL